MLYFCLELCQILTAFKILSATDLQKIHDKAMIKYPTHHILRYTTL